METNRRQGRTSAGVFFPSSYISNTHTHTLIRTSMMEVERSRVGMEKEREVTD